MEHMSEMMELRELYLTDEPVWIEHRAAALSTWGLMNNEKTNMVTMHFDCISRDYIAQKRVLAISDYGTNWKCYRHKPKAGV